VQLPSLQLTAQIVASLLLPVPFYALLGDGAALLPSSSTNPLTLFNLDYLRRQLIIQQMEILNIPTLQGRQPCFSMRVTALLLNTRPAAGHNPAGTIPRLS